MTAIFRILWTLAILLAVSSDNLAVAQSGVFRQVNVSLTTPGLTYRVDNVAYNSSQVFYWQVGDVHTITLPKASLSSDLPALGGGNNSGIGIRTTYSGTYAVTNDDGRAIPAGTFQDLTNETDSEHIYRIQVYSFLQGIEFSTSRLYQMRFVTPQAGCAPTASGQPMAGACGDNPGYTAVSCAGGASFLATTGDYWCGEGPVELHAVPAVGYAFKDWNSNPGLPNASTTGTSGSLSFELNSPFHIQVNFGPGKLYRINTEPAGFEVIVDYSYVKTGQLPEDNRSICTRYQSAGLPNGGLINIGQGGEIANSDFCTVWAFGSTRLLSATEMQLDATGKQWVFDSWSFGGGQNSLFNVSGENLSTDVITARFLRAGGVTFVTQPQISLPIIVNNRTWPSYNFWFGLNKDVTYTAPLESVDAQGRRWRFVGWSNGGPATQTLHITQEIVDKGLYLIAKYEPLNKLSIETNPPGLTVSIDGQPCQTPCAVEKLAAESVTLTPIPSVTQADVLRLEFTGWTDGGPAERTVGFTPELRRLVANYKQLYRLSAMGDPPEGATFTFNPASPDNFYDLDARVTVTAKALEGYKFRRWAGDAAGTSPATTITIGGPRGVVAELEKIPFLDPAGIKNSAGTGPQDTGKNGSVAPGSLITIYGVNLTPHEETGPVSPQKQTLAELAVRAGQRILPLSYASSSQINAQLPYDLPLGPNKLTIVRVGQPDVSADFEIVRNAPGLFGRPGTESEGVPPFVLAFRANGSVISEESPATPNEVINLIGTGLGGYRSNPPPGFAIPTGAEFALVEPVEVLVGEQTVQPLKVIATPGFVGMTSIQIRVGPQFAVGESTSLRIRVNGKESNTVRLLVR
jgi:uncharacterized protein (TIGR03437 family)